LPQTPDLVLLNHSRSPLHLIDMDTKPKPFQFGLINLFRLQTGVAGLLASAVCLCLLNPLSSVSSAPMGDFLPYVSLWTLAVYLLVREPCGRIFIYLAVILAGAIAGAAFTWPWHTWDFRPLLIIAGAGIAASWMVGFAWLDRGNMECN
jgi:hypothetical protein